MERSGAYDLGVCSSRLLFLLRALILFISGLPATQAQELTTIAAVRALTLDEADEGRPVRLRGVVTYYNSVHKVDLVLQEGQSGIFVELRNLDFKAVPGDLVEATGVTVSGTFAPNLRAHTLSVMGKSPMPAPRIANFEELASGAVDCLMVETRGIVRRAWIDQHNQPERLMLDVALGGQRFSVWILNFDRTIVERLVDAEVTIGGVCFHLFNNNGQTIAFCFMVSSDEQVRIDKAPPADPYNAKERPAITLLQRARGEVFGHRVKVRGKVLAFFPGEALWIRDATQGLLIKTAQDGTLQQGDEVEALGFPSIGEFNPRLEDGCFRRIGGGAAPDPVPTTAKQVGSHDGNLVKLSATVINGLSQPEQDVLVLQDGEAVFRAALIRRHGPLPLPELAPGTRVELTGICAVTAGDVQAYRTRLQPESFRIVLRSPRDVNIITPAPWLTRDWVVKASIILATGLVVVLSLVLLWTLLGARKNRQLRLQVAATRAAEEELQKAHDELELRVHHRTQELHAQITGRQEAEVRFAAISTERARLARELHDSLEQVLTGTALQLNAASETIHDDPAAAFGHIELARGLMRETRTEVRRSVWDLRARTLETGDLRQALEKAGEHLTGDGVVQLRVTASGPAVRLSDVLENHLLRIGQEAITNAVKHGTPRQILLHLDFRTDEVTMTVEDDGSGFEVGAAPGAATGHFGLEGIRERVKRIGGTLALQSSPGSGTKLTVVTPLEPHLLETYSA